MDNSSEFNIKVEKDIHEASYNDEYEEYVMSCKEEQTPVSIEAKPKKKPPNKTDAANGSKASPTSTKKMNTFVKKKITKHIVMNGCSSKSYEDLVKLYSKPRVDEYLETVNRMLKEAPEHVYQECESLCFENISAWLEVFKRRDIKENCCYETGIIMNAIVNTENHPRPEDLNGIDLKAVYSFVSNALMGLPQKPMDPVSATFLNKEIQSLINDANSDIADSQTMTMKERLEELLPLRAGLIPPSLDPLFLLEDTILHDDV